jgi:protein-S-isoprenylcysteine O-methyltransferase Ste14
MKPNVSLFIATVTLLCILLIPSGSPYVWQAWVYVAILMGSSLAIVLYLRRHDPDLLRRRLDAKERFQEQKLFRRIAGPLWIVGFLMSGFDHRYGWSSVLVGPVPALVTLTSDVLLVCAFYLLFRVLRFNTFASNTVQVEAGQQVISTGPYRIVRHPMYSGFVMIYLLTPFALGSYAAAPVFLLLIPALLYRLVEEERFLARELPGYSDYRMQVRYRLIPYLL